MNDELKDNSAYVRHILDAIGAIESYTEGMSFEGFRKDPKTFDAVTRQFEVIGEAARHVSESYRALHSDAPWHKMVSMRNFLAHEYLRIDLRIIWDTAKNQLPSLKSQLEPLVEKN